MPTTSVNPDKILRELRELWVDLGKHQEVPGGVLRACSMTLLAVADSSLSPDLEDVEAVHRMVGMLMHNHPSRAIVLAPKDGADLSARVFSECWMPYHSRQQICAEGIEITADPEQMDEVARLLMALVVPDLPVVLWCRGPRAFRDRTLDPLFPLAHKIIFDTGAARHAPTAMEFLRRLHKEGRSVADLAWTRLTAWRETIASLSDQGMFDHAVPEFAVYPHSFTSVSVLYAGERPGSETLYLARWIDRSCHGPSVQLEQVDGGTSEAERVSGLQGIVFNGPGTEVSVHRVSSGRPARSSPSHDALSPGHDALEIRAGGRAYRSPLPPALEESVMREELSLLDRDPVFSALIK